MPDPIYMSEAQKLREDWAARGNPPCEHAEIVRERHDLGASTSDYVCTTCGKTWWGDDPERPRR